MGNAMQSCCEGEKRDSEYSPYLEKPIVHLVKRQEQHMEEKKNPALQKKETANVKKKYKRRSKRYIEDGEEKQKRKAKIKNTSIGYSIHSHTYHPSFDKSFDSERKQYYKSRKLNKRKGENEFGLDLSSRVQSDVDTTRKSQPTALLNDKLLEDLSDNKQ